MMAEIPAHREARAALPGRLVACVLAIALGLLAHDSTAQTLKKYLTPDGKTIYSDKPVPGAKLVGEIAAPPLPDPAAVEAARQREIARGAKADRVVVDRLKAQSDARRRIEEATANLERAREALERGRTPLPGERIGTAGGGSRFTEDYLARQSANEEAVKSAEEQLQKARGL